MSLTLVLVNRGDMLRRVLIPMLCLSSKGMVHCTSDNTTIQVRDVDRRTMAVLSLEFDRCDLQNSPQCIVCINLIALSLIVAYERDEAVTVYGSDQDRNIRFEFRDIGGAEVNRLEVTQTIDPPEDWTIIDIQNRPPSYQNQKGVKIPSREIRRALVLFDLPTYVGLSPDLAVIIHVNCQEVRIIAREQSIEVHGWHVFGLQQDEQLLIRMAFKNIKSYIAASRFSDMVWLFEPLNASAPNVMVFPILVEGVIKAFITYFYFSYPIPPFEEN